MNKIARESSNIRLISYVPGGSGHFIYNVVNNCFADTIKVLDDDSQFSANGNSHSTKQFLRKYNIDRFLANNPNKTVDDFRYNMKVVNSNVSDGHLAVILCDMGAAYDFPDWLTRDFPNAKILRVYAEKLISKIIVMANLFEKIGLYRYKNALFTEEHLSYLRNKNSDFDDSIVRELVDVFENNFREYGGFDYPVDHPQFYNIEASALYSYESFYFEMVNLARFFETQIEDKIKMKQLYDEYMSLQHNVKYVTMTKDSVPSDDDLIGRALVEYYRSK